MAVAWEFERAEAPAIKTFPARLNGVIPLRSRRMSRTREIPLFISINSWNNQKSFALIQTFKFCWCDSLSSERTDDVNWKRCTHNSLHIRIKKVYLNFCCLQRDLSRWSWFACHGDSDVFLRLLARLLHVLANKYFNLKEFLSLLSLWSWFNLCLFGARRADVSSNNFSSKKNVLRFIRRCFKKYKKLQLSSVASLINKRTYQNLHFNRTRGAA